MAILERLLGPVAASPSPADDFWYMASPGQVAYSGARVNEESALKISTVYGCVSAIAQDVAAMPLHLYRRLSDGGKERARNMALYDILNHRPNQWQTTQEFIEMLLGHLLLRGNAYCIIESGPTGFVQQLIPLNPSRMEVEQLPSMRLRYRYRWDDGTQQIFSQEAIWHIRGMSSDGLVGLSVVGLARESFGLGLATEEYAARYFSQNAQPSGVLQTDGRLDPEQAQRLGAQWSAAHAGLANARKVAVLEHGVKWQQVGMSNDDSQFLESRTFQVEDMARWFHMPLGRIGHTEKATTWGTGLEQSNIWYITYALLPWIRRIESRILADLIVDNSGNLYAEFLMDHLMRGDTSARFTAYGMGIRDGWLSRNEARAKENMDPREGLDDMLVPQNMARVTEDGEIERINQPVQQLQPPQPPVPPGEPPPPEDTRARLLAAQLAAIAVRRESIAIAKIRRRTEDEPEAQTEQVTAFYTNHQTTIAKDLHLSQEQAQRYCEDHRDDTEENKIRVLADLALGGIND